MSEDNNPRTYQRFMTSLKSIATLCKFEIDESIYELYDRHLAPLGYSNLANAIDEIAANRKANEPFPSIREIREKIQPVVSQKSLADDVANRLIAAFRKHGSHWPQGYGAADSRYWDARDSEGKTFRFESFQEALEFEVGEVGVATVKRMGGYSYACSEWGMSENVSTFRAQLRDLAASIVEQAKAGVLHTPPALPEPTARAQIGSAPKQIGEVMQGLLKSLPQMPKGEKNE